jgi:hypothetical protein
MAMEIAEDVGLSGRVRTSPTSSATKSRSHIVAPVVHYTIVATRHCAAEAQHMRDEDVLSIGELISVPDTFCWRPDEINVNECGVTTYVDRIYKESRHCVPSRRAVVLGDVMTAIYASTSVVKDRTIIVLNELGEVWWVYISWINT